MREIVLDTETTGLDPEKGDRIVEIGCVELEGHLPTGRTYQTYINPGRPMGAEAVKITGITDEMLVGQPRFENIVDKFLDFIGDAPLVIHNAAFDVKFLNHEINRAGRAAIPFSRAIDTVDIARKRFPGAQVNLDALCRRLGVDSFERAKHGALLDSQILAEVYLQLLGGRQQVFSLEAGVIASSATRTVAFSRSRALPPRLSREEEAAHAAFVEALGEAALWLRCRMAEAAE